ncbi:extracellular solute-binding protein [Paenibacillus sp.]|uniref:extracellular solute-binding protein n=1 Tax=Paenibacillus sp. TaxID=58172 RepID=UPI002810DDE1|nr:extracellular solute-binding protein [Paenibacillus sp.]
MERATGYRNWVAAHCATLALSVVLSACSGSASEGSEPAADPTGDSAAPAAEAQSEAPAGPVKVSILNAYFSNTAPKEDGAVVAETERISNAELDITWVPFNVYNEKLNVTMTSGEMPQVIMVDNPFTTSILNGIHSGMFWELTPYVDEFPNLKRFDEAVLNNLAIDGKMYLVPRPRPFVRNGLIVREDWLKKLNLEVPKTIDEFYNMLVAFRDQDPDGNGTADTYGIMFYEGTIPADIFAWHGAPNNWKAENGTFIKDLETAEYREGLKFVRKLYEEQLVNEDFPVVVRNEARKNLYNNKVGASIEALDAVVPYYYFQMEETKNFFDLTAGGPIEGKAFSTPGHYGGALIPKTSVKSEEELKQVLRYFDTQNSPEASEAFAKLANENEAKPSEEKFNIDDLKNLIVNNAAIYPPGDSELNVMLKSRMEEHAAVGVADPSNGLISPTETEKSEQLKTILADAKIQFVLGQIDEGGLDAAVEEWKKAGGAKVAEELAELYANK